METDGRDVGARARRSAAAREKMVAAAVELIAEGGSAGMTLAKVGTSAGYSRGLADYHFGSKAKLIEEVVDAIGRSVRREVIQPALEGTHGLDAVLACTEAYFAGARRSPTHFRALYVLEGESLATVPEIRATVAAQDERYRDLLRRQIGDGLQDGSVRTDIDVEAAAALVLALVRGATLQWLVDPGRVDLDVLARHCLTTVRAQLAGHAPADELA